MAPYFNYIEQKLENAVYKIRYSPPCNIGLFPQSWMSGGTPMLITDQRLSCPLTQHVHAATVTSNNSM